MIVEEAEIDIADPEVEAGVEGDVLEVVIGGGPDLVDPDPDHVEDGTTVQEADIDDPAAEVDAHEARIRNEVKKGGLKAVIGTEDQEVEIGDLEAGIGNREAETEIEGQEAKTKTEG